MKSVRFLTAVVVTLISMSIGLLTSVAYAEAPPKPKLITVATFDIGASTYAEVSAISNAIIKKFDIKIRIIPIGNSVARAIATRAGSTQIWGSCSSYYAAEEGLFALLVGDQCEHPAIAEEGRRQDDADPVRVGPVDQSGPGPAAVLFDRAVRSDLHREDAQVGEQIEAIGLPTVFIFEGGYAVSALGENVAALLRGFRRP